MAETLGVYCGEWTAGSSCRSEEEQAELDALLALETRPVQTYRRPVWSG
jgi:hypothetical protein